MKSLADVNSIFVLALAGQGILKFHYEVNIITLFLLYGLRVSCFGS